MMTSFYHALSRLGGSPPEDQTLADGEHVGDSRSRPAIASVNAGRLIVTYLDRDLEAVGMSVFKRKSGM